MSPRISFGQMGTGNKATVLGFAVLGTCATETVFNRNHDIKAGKDFILGLKVR